MKVLNKDFVTIKKVVSVLMFICTSLFMYGFYKSLSGFIANGFTDGIRMIAMILSYILPVICFLFFFYNYYVKKINRIVSFVYSIVVILFSILNFYLISLNFDVYVSNNALGVYQAIPSIIVAFPYDIIVVNSLLILVEVFNLVCSIKPNGKCNAIKEKLYMLGCFKLNVFEYIIASILSILVFVFVGNFICSLQALENALFDFRFIFLMLWILIIPFINLFSMIFKFEFKDYSFKSKIIYLLSLIFTNLIFILLLFIFEHSKPSFIVHIGQSLFPITFSIAFPVEILVILGIQVIFLIVDAIKLLFVLKHK